MVTIYSGKVDLGTGIRTALVQIAADELDVPLRAVTIVQGDTLLTPDQNVTFGSLSIQVGGMQLRQACAAARKALTEEAAKKLGTTDLTVTDGVISGGGKKVSYAELIGGKSFAITLDPKTPVKEKDPKNYKVVGKPVARLDIPDKITAKYTYMQDFRLPGMLHARVVRPPALEAKLESVDESSLKGVPGNPKVVREGNFLAVVADTEWGAIKGAAKLKATWSKSETLPDQNKLWEHVRATKVVKDDVTSNVGNTAEAMAKDGAKTVKATYDFAIHMHGSIGPSCAVAEFKDGKLTSWSASQATHNLRKQLAQMLALPAENVRCIYHRRLRLLRPQRPRGCGRRRRAPGQDGGQAGARAMVAGRRARLGSEGPADAGRSARGNGWGWQCRRLGIGILHSARRRRVGAADTGDARRPAIHAADRAWNDHQQLGDPVQIPQRQDHLPPSGIDAVPSVLDPDAGAHAEHLRQRMLHRRARRGGRDGSD